MTIKLIKDLDSEKYISEIFSLLQQLTDAPIIDINLYNNISFRQNNKNYKPKCI